MSMVCWTGTVTPQVQVSEGWMRVGEYHCGEALQLLDLHYKEPPMAITKSLLTYCRKRVKLVVVSRL